MAGPAQLQRSTEVQQTAAGPADYLEFFLFHAIGLLSILAILVGGGSASVGLFVVVVAYVAGDALLGDDLSTPHYRWPGVLTAQLRMALPLLSLIVFSALWSVSPRDVLGFGAWLEGLSGFDFVAARETTAGVYKISTLVLTGLMVGMVGTIAARELTHRTWDPISMAVGRWLLAFSFDTIFAMEHVYGHHRYVSTADDPATAPRGRNVYAHIVASTVGGNIRAWKIERLRLQRKGLGLYSWHNAVIRGHSMSLLLVGLAWAMGGFWTALFFVACALWGKSLLEIVKTWNTTASCGTPYIRATPGTPPKRSAPGPCST